MPTLKAFAKINLGLHILGSREDGFHDVETVFHRINLFDEVTLGASETLSLECSSPGLPTDDRNLCYRAALQLRKELGIEEGAKIRLRKNIPVGGGLGGGSSDAAATLLGLLNLWNAELPVERLRSIALRLGSDVPYFLKEGSAYATGRGEMLDYFPLEIPYWIVAVFPDLEISTEWAYRHLREARESDPDAIGSRPPVTIKEILLNEMNHPRRLRSLLRNDFERLVLKTYPGVARVKRVLYDAGAVLARLSGSGSSLFGLFLKEEQARSAARIFDSGFRVSLTPPNFVPDLQPAQQ